MALTINNYGYVIKVTGTTAAAEVVTANFIRLGGILWFKPTTIGHALSVTDSAGQSFVQGYCDLADISKWWNFQDQPVNGLKIDDMDSGTVYIYVKKGRA